ncbi:MAG: hypothetical protein R3F62_06695 [Planctomycetota bacterium]
MDDADGSPDALTPRARRRQRWRRGALVVALLALPVAELGLRLLWPQPPRGFSAGLFQTTPGEPTRLAPGAAGTHYSREFHVEVAADSAGYRADVGVDPDARDGAVWCLGDSFLFGWGVAAPEVATARLTAGGIPCANLGMPGDGLASYRQRLQAALAGDARPRAVVLVLYDNDLSEFGDATLAASGGPGLRGRVLALHTVRLGGRLLDGLGLSTWAANLGGYRAQRLAILRRDLWIHDPARAPELEPALAHLRQTLELVPAGVPRHVVRIVPVYAAGGEASAAAAAALEQPGLEFGALGARLRAACAAAGASYAELRPSTPEEEARWYFPFDLHLTAAGQAALAEVVRGALDEHPEPAGGPR